MRRRFLSVIAAVAALTLILAACGGGDDNGGGATAGSSGKTPKVGVILPDTKSSARWETADKPLPRGGLQGRRGRSTTSRTPRATRPSSRPSPTR